MTILDKPLELPENQDAELALIGCLLADNTRWPEVAETVSADDFFNPHHAEVFGIISRLVGSGTPVDAATLGTHYQGREHVGEFIGNLYQAQRHAMGWACMQYAATVRDLSARRKLIDACQTTCAELYNEHLDLDVADIAGALQSAMEKAMRHGHSTSLGIEELHKRIRDRVYGEPQITPTGIAPLDDAMCGGLEPGRVYGIMARPKQGKTFMAGSISYNLNQRGIKQLVIALEMGAEAIHQRSLARAMGCNELAFRSKEEVKREGFQRRMEKCMREIKLSTQFEDAAGLTLDRLKRLVIGGKQRHDIEGFFLDYLQLVEGKERGENKAEFIERVAKWCADITKQLGIWGVVVIQENKDGAALGSDGAHRSFDQVYRLKQCDSKTESSPKYAFMEMIESRHTPWRDIGSEDYPELELDVSAGPHYRPIDIKEDLPV